MGQLFFFERRSMQHFTLCFSRQTFVADRNMWSINGPLEQYCGYFWPLRLINHQQKHKGLCLKVLLRLLRSQTGQALKHPALVKSR